MLDASVAYAVAVGVVDEVGVGKDYAEAAALLETDAPWSVAPDGLRSYGV